MARLSQFRCEHLQFTHLGFERLLLEGHNALSMVPLSWLLAKLRVDSHPQCGLMNHAPDLIMATDKRSGMLPIEMATKQRHLKTIIYDILKRDMPIDLKEVHHDRPHHFAPQEAVESFFGQPSSSRTTKKKTGDDGNDEAWGSTGQVQY
ncbi:hypothetical protein ACHAW5_009792 [Stephanodiscus triporus]|uniref:Uncharacterized protein n=1 Tax=Stephanodiscus triporus TaxID=2934178 RepID=A0ABD3PAX7_9STRA